MLSLGKNYKSLLLTGALFVSFCYYVYRVRKEIKNQNRQAEHDEIKKQEKRSEIEQIELIDNFNKMLYPAKGSEVMPHAILGFFRYQF